VALACHEASRKGITCLCVPEQGKNLRQLGQRGGFGLPFVFLVYLSSGMVARVLRPMKPFGARPR
jgi:hypothetical protein